MRLPVLCLAALLFGCAGPDDPSADNHGYGWEYDAIGPTGLRVQYADDLPDSLRAPLADLESAWVDTAACVGIEPAPPGPLVVLVPDAFTCGAAYPAIGCTYLDTRTIVVAAHRLTFALRHEYVHVLLERTDHHSYLFDACG